ncbi:unnamed protein product [Leptidea sinapis]|uniref:Uncharacterized protein n=1 Tax=Leptidea sinapis TaxID=189913 RepID=A0A5E4Q3R2_9NEOP|nr:unnamed protein product [Leptidea sinapis]
MVLNFQSKLIITKKNCKFDVSNNCNILYDMPSSPQAVFFLDFKAACNSTIVKLSVRYELEGSDLRLLFEIEVFSTVSGWEDDIHLKGNHRPSIHKIKVMKRIPLSNQDHSAANCLSQL